MMPQKVYPPPSKPSQPKFVWTVRKKLKGFHDALYYTTSIEAWGKSGTGETRCPVCRETLDWRHFGPFMKMHPGEIRINDCEKCGATLALIKAP